MNYEEMLGRQDGVATHREELPLGTFYKKLIDRKYRNVLELKPQLSDNIMFCEGLKNDQKLTSTIISPAQLHYELHADSSGIYEIEIEQGNFQTFAQLIESNPAVVATPGYVDSTIEALLTLTEQLHEKGVYHLCYAPQYVFTRKSDNAPLLLCHGSSFAAMSSLASLYEGFEQFVAPEVLEGGTIGEQSDVYALGRFVEWFFQHGDMPIEYRRVVAKATQAEPEHRYQSVADMKAALTQTRGIKQTALMLGGAMLVVLVAVWLYFELVPQTEKIEFVEGAPKEEVDDFLDDGFDPETELGLWADNVDTLAAMTQSQQDAYLDKAEAIYRRQYRKQADRILSKVYNREGMSLSEKDFIQATSAMTDELQQVQERLASQAGISAERAARIASEEIERLAADKQKNLQNYGFQHQQEEDD